MSARDDLINGLTEHACCFSDQDAKRMVDAFAQVLADKQRAWLGEYMAELGEAPHHQDDATEMIEMIEPKREGA